jgi:7,8-dihydropterin-6-yl-methyl-4-(beta-D-ribofuranosyl)aminobenzene 5'-phosphate synthase
MRFIAFFELPPDKMESYITSWKDRVPKGKDFKFIIPPSTLPEPIHGITGCVIFELKSPIPPKILVEQFLAPFTQKGAKVTLRYLFEDKKLAKELKDFHSGEEKAELEWTQTTYPKFTNIGETKQLTILPLIDWHSSQGNLRQELGVSYLIQTDENTVLFDVGWNMLQEDPSPLLQNMNQLGVSLSDIDTIVISHNHADHTGGFKWTEKKTFSLSVKQLDLPGIQVYTPVPMKYPGLQPVYAKDPIVIGKGLVTIGSISNAMFFLGLGIEYEQALAINVEKKGIVLIVGCGHQTLPKILARAEALFQEPIYGIIGGLHLSVEGGPVDIAGMSPHKYFGTGKVPWEFLSLEDLKANIELLKLRQPKVVALSPHDSSPLSLSMFQDAFPDAYRYIRVGEKIHI